MKNINFHMACDDLRRGLMKSASNKRRAGGVSFCHYRKYRHRTKTVSYQEMVHRTDKAILFRMRDYLIWFPRAVCPYIDSERKRVVIYKDFLKAKLKEAEENGKESEA